MSWLRELGSTGLQVSALGLGTVKLGRNQAVKYPANFALPDERSARRLLRLAGELGVNLLDTAPAYGSSEERLGRLLAGRRRDWIICTKVGEEFEQGQSRFDFSPEHTRQSVLRSLRRLGTDVLDIVLVHSDGRDLGIIEQMGTLEMLAQLKREGLLRAFGISTKTVAGGLAAAAVCDVLMVTYNLVRQEERPVLDECARLGRGALVKKVLDSGNLPPADGGHGTGRTPQQASLELVLAHPGTSAAIVGTINPLHLRSNVEAARRALG
jgi:aryl-alcohol dehydrogenase-like predicted oxidoreductase